MDRTTLVDIKNGTLKQKVSLTPKGGENESRVHVIKHLQSSYKTINQ